MPTYQCKQCGNLIIIPVQPSQCENCGFQKFSVVSALKSAKSSQQKSNLSRKFALSKPNLSSLKSTSKSSNLKSSSQKTSPSTTSSSKKKPLQSSIPAYSTPLSSQLANPSNFYSETSKNSKNNQYKYPEKVSKKQNLNWYLPWVIASGIIILGLIIYSKWNSQFTTNDFKKISLIEDFSPAPQNWTLTKGAKFQNGGLFQSQPQPNLQGTSIWNGHIFTDVDYSADVTLLNGVENLPFGIAARINGSDSQNFYYLLIDGKGEFSLGKHSKNKWENKIGWQFSRKINKGKKAKNKLRIVCKEDLIIGFINGQQVGSFRDQAYKSGKIALFSRRGNAQGIAVYFDNLLLKERDTEISSVPPKTPSPKQVIQAYYDKQNTTGENQKFWDLVNQVKIAEIKTLTQTNQQAKVKVWLQYKMKNGATICESRVFNLQFEQQQKIWVIKNSSEVVQNPSCKL